MKSSTLIVWLLVAACIAIDLAMIGELQVRRNEWPEAGGVIGLGLVFSQVTLMALWTVWGRSHILFRGVSALLGVWAVSFLASYSERGGPLGVGTWFGVLLLFCGVSLIPFIIARFANFTLTNEAEEKPHSTGRRLSSNQFTIWGLLSLMTAVGIALAVTRFAEFPMEQLLEVAVFFTLLAASVCAVLLLALYVSRLLPAILATTVICAICPVAGVLLSLTELNTGEGTLDLVVMMCVQGVASLFAAIVLRAGGYRLVRHTAPSAAKAAGSSVESASTAAGQRDEP
jgi:hypothetical protein